MYHKKPHALQFFLSSPVACPYLKERIEQKLFIEIAPENADTLNGFLTHQGFRRSQNIIYRPTCPDCQRCISVRIPIKKFHTTRSMRRILNRNKNLDRKIMPPRATNEQYELFRDYLKARHGSGDMTSMDRTEYTAMIEETLVETAVLEYYDPARDGDIPELVCLTDVLKDGLSMVYSFFRTDRERYSLGSFAILDHIRLAKKLGLEYVYLGYWVKQSPQMDYKKNFQPLEAYCGDKWVAFETIEPRPD